jgi:HEAT repeat protein
MWWGNDHQRTLRTMGKLLRKPCEAKRFRSPWLALTLAAAALTCACGADDPAGPGSAPEEPFRPALELPDTTGPDAKIAFYLDLLRRGDRDEVVWAHGQLVLAGDRVAGALGELIREALPKNPVLAESALTVLAGKVNGRDAIPAMVEAAQAKDGLVRVLAARALGFTAAPEAVAPLLDLACSKNDNVSRAAAGSLDRLGTEKAARGLLGRFPDELNPAAQATAIGVIGRCLPDAEAVDFLAALVEDRRDYLGVAASASLAGRGDKRGFDGLWRAQELHSGPLRWHALEVLAESRDERALEVLIEAAGSDGPQVQVAAAALLGFYETEEARSVLRELSRSSDPNVRREAFLALQRSGDPGALREIRKLLRRSEEADRLLAAQLLAQLMDPSTIPDLVRSTDLEENPRIRLLLARALARIGRPEGAPAALRVLMSEDEDDPAQSFTAHNAAAVLASFGTLPGEVLDELERGTRSESASLRLNASKVLAATERGERARDALTRLLDDPSADVRRTAARLWLGLDDVDPAPIREAYLGEPIPEVAELMASVARRAVHCWR